MSFAEMEVTVAGLKPVRLAMSALPIGIITPGNDFYDIRVKQTRHGILLNGFLHGNKKKITLARPLSTDDDFLGIEKIDQSGNANAKDPARLIEYLDRRSVPTLSQ